MSGSGREAEGWLPRPAGSPGPNTALMRATGTDGHTQGAGDYCAGPRGAGERDPRRGGEESPVGSPAADLLPLQSFCKHVLVLPFDDGTCLEYLYKPACRYMWTSCFIYTSCMHDVSLPDTPENVIKRGTLCPTTQLNTNFC